MSNLRQLQLYKQNQIATADPGKILLMLYEGVIDALKRATQHLAAGNMAEKGICILQAHDIITQFVVSLDYEIGGELAYNLETLYHGWHSSCGKVFHPASMTSGGVCASSFFRPHRRSRGDDIGNSYSA